MSIIIECENSQECDKCELRHTCQKVKFDFVDDLKWFEEPNDTIIGRTLVSVCIRCHKRFKYVSRGSKRRVCDNCKTPKKRGYGKKWVDELW